MNITLLDLNKDVLFLIVSFLSVKDIGRLSQVCRELREFCSQDTVWRAENKKGLLAVTAKNQQKYSKVQLKEICRVSRNWEWAIMKERKLIQFKTQFLPWIQLYKNYLYVSQGEDVYCYRVKNNGNISKTATLVLSKHVNDICQFAVKNGFIVSGARDNNINIWRLGKGPNARFIRSLSGHSRKVSYVDTHEGLVLSGSADQSWRLWSVEHGRCLLESEMSDRVLSVAINPWHRSIITGTTCINVQNPLDIWNVENGKHVVTLGHNFKRGAGVLDVQYEDPHTVLSCGYDTYLRIWDTRSSRSCVQEYEEFDDNALYCLQSNGGYLLATGSNRFGVVRLWDKRMTKCLKKFYIGNKKSGSVYSLQFNLTNLYASLSHSIQTLDFSTS